METPAEGWVCSIFLYREELWNLWVCSIFFAGKNCITFCEILDTDQLAIKCLGFLLHVYRIAILFFFSKCINFLFCLFFIDSLSNQFLPSILLKLIIHAHSSVFFIMHVYALSLQQNYFIMSLRLDLNGEGIREFMEGFKLKS